MRPIAGRAARTGTRAFRSHLRRLAGAGALGEGIVAICRYWADRPQQGSKFRSCLTNVGRRARLRRSGGWRLTTPAQMTKLALSELDRRLEIGWTLRQPPAHEPVTLWPRR